MSRNQAVSGNLHGLLDPEGVSNEVEEEEEEEAVDWSAIARKTILHHRQQEQGIRLHRCPW